MISLSDGAGKVRKTIILYMYFFDTEDIKN